MEAPQPSHSPSTGPLVEIGRKPRTSDCASCVILAGLREVGLPASTVGQLCQRLWLTRARRRQILFLEGNRATHVFALRKGRVKLTKTDASGGEHIVAVLESGALFGVNAMFGRDHGTSAEALGEVELCVGSKQEVEALLAEAPLFGVSLARYLQDPLDEARARQACLGTVGARARLAAWLLHEANKRGERRDEIPHDLTLADYGAVVGTSPETVCRVLRDLRERGVVEVLGSVIRILDPGRLRRFAKT